MSLKCGIVGLPNVGKSTLFNCLSSAKAQAANFPFCNNEPNLGVITVPDERLTKLAEIVHPGRIVPATCEIVDIAGLVKGASKGEGLGNKFLGNIRECDAIIHVIRCFEDDNIVREGGMAVDPIEDKSIIDTELQLKDLETVESQLQKNQKIAALGNNKDAKILVNVLLAYKEALEQGKNARSVTFESKEEQQAAHDLFLLTTKPVLYVANVDEASAKEGNEYSRRVEAIAAEEGAEVRVIAAKTEEDIAGLVTYEDKQMFLEELGLEESGVNRLIKKAYALLNLETFITAGEMEVKAWTYHKGWKAPQCAGVIHTDFEKGFIRAEVIKYEDYLKYGSEAAVREAGKLGIEGKYLAELSKTVIEHSKDGYPELEEKQSMIFKVLTEEEDKFNKTIDQGLAILAEMEDAMAAAGEKTLSGENAFKLYDTYGFPVDLTKEILEEKGCTVDEEGFAAAMKEQKDKARKARKTTNYMGADATVYEQIDVAITTEFVGYDRLTHESEIVAIAGEDAVVDSLSEGENGSILVNETPFYATMGGQCGDAGVIETATGKFIVKDTIKVVGGKIAHIGYVENGEIKLSDTAKLSVDADKRLHTCMNHSATHLLQKALKTVLGGHVEQAGSYVDQDRLRFDFTHYQALSKEEIEQVEAIVNEKIAEDLPVVTKVMSLEEAKKTGAMALYGEKYG